MRKPVPDPRPASDFITMRDGRAHYDGNAHERANLEIAMRWRGISEEIIARVMRLNPHLVAGRELRGIHYTLNGRYYAHLDGSIGKGEAIRIVGRERFYMVPKSFWIRDGKRIRVPLWALRQAERL